GDAQRAGHPGRLRGLPAGRLPRRADDGGGRAAVAAVQRHLPLAGAGGVDAGADREHPGGVERGDGGVRLGRPGGEVAEAAEGAAGPRLRPALAPAEKAVRRPDVLPPGEGGGEPGLSAGAPGGERVEEASTAALRVRAASLASMIPSNP